MEDELKLPCAEKLAFDTAKEARAVAVTSAYHHGDNPGVRPYRCPHCHLWHLATNTPD